MNAESFKKAIRSISALMAENKDYLNELDAQNGDGDLGLSMNAGFSAIDAFLRDCDETDPGKLLMQCGRVFNESAPSTLGTIIAFGMMGMAGALKGKTEVSAEELAGAMDAGISRIMDKTGSKPGEKTVLDALCPAVEALKNDKSFAAAYDAAVKGSESTKEMRAVHGRAAYYGDKSIGILDAGSVAGKIIFEGLCRALN